MSLLDALNLWTPSRDLRAINRPEVEDLLLFTHAGLLIRTAEPFFCNRQKLPPPKQPANDNQWRHEHKANEQASHGRVPNEF